MLITDGSCLGNPGKGGWAFILKLGDTVISKSGNEKQTTNNRMELVALIRGLEEYMKVSSSSDLEVILDSNYVLKGITDWIKNWKKNGWKNSQKQDVKNKDLWLELDSFMDKLNIKFTWVKGHSGHEIHDKVDVMAREAASEL
ncbi:ribonuclease HI [Candidatus Nesciobacter abundans]|uniref:Ribonuclease H n=1 Tax=Candidatus Nesciobacter abundans TaxID=2601668 RepID=A0A5C0UJ83_9PROT|nr:ribonuclease HI [Candidatus Nesciobacter abundans]QEK38864.1 ribonuclease HI [Candidatus Nesciobacter abundans]